MLTYPLTSGVATTFNYRVPKRNFGTWIADGNLNIREYSDLFTTSNLTQTPAITTLYSGAGLSVAADFWNATWHNYPNITPASVRTSLSGETLNALGFTFHGARSHDYYPNGTGSVRWHHLEPTKGNFVWDNLDEFVDTNLAEGRDVTYVLGYCPAWATGTGSGDSHYDNGADPISSSNAPTRMTDFTDMCGAIATRFEGRIAYYEVWNEPETTAFYNGTNTQMAQMYRLANQTIKAIDPAALIVGPSSNAVSSTARSKLTNILTASDGNGGTGATGSLGEKWLDVISFHQYYSGVTNFSAFAADLTSYNSILTTYGLNTKPLWCNELGINSAHISTDNPGRALAYLLRMIYLMAINGIDRIWYYAVDDTVLSPFYFFNNTSMVDTVNTHLSHLINGEVTLVNMLTDGTLAIVADGTNYLI